MNDYRSFTEIKKVDSRYIVSKLERNNEAVQIEPWSPRIQIFFTHPDVSQTFPIGYDVEQNAVDGIG